MSDPKITDDDFAPRAATDKGPLDCSREILRAQYARHFQTCANLFRALPRPCEGLQDIKLATKCGQLLIQAYERGLLPEILELHELIRWHTAAPKPTGRLQPQAVYVRCPANLFLDLAGGNAVEARNVGGKFFFLLDEFGDKKRTGGLLPRMDSGLLELPDNERYACACLMLADLLHESPPVAADQPSGQGEQQGNKPAAGQATDGTVESDSIWLNGRRYKLTPDLRRILAYFFFNPGVSVKQVIHDLTFTDINHFHKRLLDLRTRLQKDMKNSDKSLVIDLDGEAHISCKWVSRT